jgi:hypothetical protein
MARHAELWIASSLSLLALTVAPVAIQGSFGVMPD